ncbi:32924_t:CDS:2, partial [Gigaspora margarita]
MAVPNVTYLSGKRKKTEGETCLISLVEGMIELVVEVHQRHLARSCLDQVKHECQEQVIGIRFIKIIDPKVAIPIKNKALPVRSDRKTNSSNKPKTARI